MRTARNRCSCVPGLQGHTENLFRLFEVSVDDPVMKRNSISNKLGKYFDFLNTSATVDDNPVESDMKQMDSNSSHQPNQPIRRRVKPRNGDVFDTKNFDQIDYIVQIPLITKPEEQQSRFLLAMDYTLPSRDGLGLMDTALEHIMHYYDMEKVELIFCEMWQSVCLFIEFKKVAQCKRAYTELPQFFKTVFYVVDLRDLEEMWICAHCKHHNQCTPYHQGTNHINDTRKDHQGNEVVYWCPRCRNLNDPSFKKIKYSYSVIPTTSSHHNSHSLHSPSINPKCADASKSMSNLFIPNNNSMNSVNSINSMNHNNASIHYEQQSHNGMNGMNGMNPMIDRSSTEPIYSNNSSVPSHDSHHPPFQIAKSHPVSLNNPTRDHSTIPSESSLSPTSSIYAQMMHHAVPHPAVNRPSASSVISDDDSTPLGGNMLIGNCPSNALVQFNIPYRSNARNHNNHHHRNNHRVVMRPSKSVPLHPDQPQPSSSSSSSSTTSTTRQYRNGSGGSDIVPSSSPPYTLGSRGHGPKYSVDSTVSMASTTSSVHSINGGLDLAFSVLENIDPQIQSLGHGGSAHGAMVYDDAVTRDTLQRLEAQREEVVSKIVKMCSMLKRIESTFTSAIDLHALSMEQSLHRFDEEEKGSNGINGRNGRNGMNPNHAMNGMNGIHRIQGINGNESNLPNCSKPIQREESNRTYRSGINGNSNSNNDGDNNNENDNEIDDDLGIILEQNTPGGGAVMNGNLNMNMNGMESMDRKRERVNQLTSSNLNKMEQNQMFSGSDMDDDKALYTHSLPSSVEPDPGEDLETPLGGHMVIGQAHGSVSFMKQFT